MSCLIASGQHPHRGSSLRRFLSCGLRVPVVHPRGCQSEPTGRSSRKLGRNADNECGQRHLLLSLRGGVLIRGANLLGGSLRVLWGSAAHSDSPLDRRQPPIPIFLHPLHRIEERLLQHRRHRPPLPRTNNNPIHRPHRRDFRRSPRKENLIRRIQGFS